MTKQNNMQAAWPQKRLMLVIKPAVTTCIVIGAALVPLHSTEGYRIAVLIALVLCLIGDTCLLLSGRRWFLAGLISFLLAHLVFIVAFLQGLSGFVSPWWNVFIAAYGLVFAIKLIPHTGKLKLPVALYCMTIIALALVAATRWHMLGTAPAMLAMLGTLLFVASDSLLSIRQFFGAYRFSAIAILATYWAAIALIALSV
jgi:alkenylglycerophosphocholine/alkenylglycerophosphoethanolamine hydrolase